MAQLDQDAAGYWLQRAFSEAEEGLQNKRDFPLHAELQHHLQVLFEAKTQAYREVLLGCILTRLQDKTIDVHLPYLGHGSASYHARRLDEEVINPFLKEKQIPSSKGPFLSVFRRAVRFDASNSPRIERQNCL